MCVNKLQFNVCEILCKHFFFRVQLSNVVIHFKLKEISKLYGKLNIILHHFLSIIPKVHLYTLIN